MCEYRGFLFYMSIYRAPPPSLIHDGRGRIQPGRIQPGPRDPGHDGRGRIQPDPRDPDHDGRGRIQPGRAPPSGLHATTHHTQARPGSFRRRVQPHPGSDKLIAMLRSRVGTHETSCVELVQSGTNPMASRADGTTLMIMHRLQSMGHGAWGMGHGAWGTIHLLPHPTHDSMPPSPRPCLCQGPHGWLRCRSRYERRL